VDAVAKRVAKLFEWRQANARNYKLGATYGIYPCDPENTPPEQLRIEFAVEVDRSVEPGADGIHDSCIPAGRCAVLRNVGMYAAQEAIRWLFGEWLPGSGEQLRDFPLYCHFVAADASVPEHRKAIDVYVPLR
jgi:AraC family transcriptional regulator